MDDGVTRNRSGSGSGSSRSGSMSGRAGGDGKGATSTAVQAGAEAVQADLGVVLNMAIDARHVAELDADEMQKSRRQAMEAEGRARERMHEVAGSLGTSGPAGPIGPRSDDRTLCVAERTPQELAAL